MQCSRHEQSLAVVFLDLDGFKQVNDTHSHNVADELLIAVSIRMKEALREGDTLACIGSDEFVAVLTDLTIVEGVETIEHGTKLLELGCDLAQGYGIANQCSAVTYMRG